MCPLESSTPIEDKTLRYLYSFGPVDPAELGCAGGPDIRSPEAFECDSHFYSATELELTVGRWWVWSSNGAAIVARILAFCYSRKLVQCPEILNGLD